MLDTIEEEKSKAPSEILEIGWHNIIDFGTNVFGLVNLIPLLVIRLQMVVGLYHPSTTNK